MDIQNKNQWNDAFFEACENGHLENVRHLCQKQYLDLGLADIHIREDDYQNCYEEYGFRMACWNGHLDVVKYLLTSHELIQAGHTFVDLHANNELGFRWACKNGHLEIVKYLLTSPELKKAGHTFVNLHADDEEGFCEACRFGHLAVVKYLLTSSELIEAGHTFANLHAGHESGFRLACGRGHLEVVRWLVMDHGIDKTTAIEEIIKEYPQAKEYFRVREELKEIQTTLKTSNPNPYPPSIETHNADRRAPKKAKKL